MSNINPQLTSLPVKYDDFQSKITISDGEIYSKPDSVSQYASLALIPDDEVHRSLINQHQATPDLIEQMQTFGETMPLYVPVLLNPQPNQPQENFYYIHAESLTDDGVLAASLLTEYRYFTLRNVPAKIAWTGANKFPYNTTLSHTIVYLMPENFVQTTSFSGYFNINGTNIYLKSKHLLYGNSQENKINYTDTPSLLQLKSFFSKLQYFHVHSFGSHLYAYDLNTSLSV
jgi:hypothetical protein